MTPAENLRRAAHSLSGFWLVRVLEIADYVPPFVEEEREDIAGALLAARNRRATALAAAGWRETPRSEREVPLIRALTVVEIGGAP